MGGWSLLGPGVSPCRSASPCTGRECATQGLPWPLSPHPDRAQEPETCQDTRPAKMTLLSNISGTEAPLCRDLCLTGLAGWKQQWGGKIRSVSWLRVPTKIWPQERSKPSRVLLVAGGKML